VDPLLINADEQPQQTRPPSLRARLNQHAARALAWPFATPDRRWISVSVLATGAVIVGVWAFLALRPIPKPDPASDAIDRVFGYALLTKEFNKLPIEERLELVGQIIQRVKQMDQSDSLMLASFAAGIQGAAREQLMENTARLMIDTADMLAKDYVHVPPEEKEQFLEDAFIRLTELGAAMTGEPITQSREERLREAREQARRDEERLKDRPMSIRQAGRTFKFMDGMGQHASPQQRGRVTVLMRDMVRHLRGQDISTGKPKEGG